MKQQKSTYKRFQTLIPELSDWNEGRGADVFTWMQCMGSFEQAIAYSELFWPSFVKVNNCICFQIDFDFKKFEDALKEFGYDKTKTEIFFNNVSIYDLHTGMSDEKYRPEPTLEQVLYLGQILEETWQAKLARDFPDIKAIAKFNELEVLKNTNWTESQKLEEFAVTVFCIR